MLEFPNNSAPWGRSSGPPWEQEALQPSSRLTDEDEQPAWHSISLQEKPHFREGVRHGGGVSSPQSLSPVKAADRTTLSQRNLPLDMGNGPGSSRTPLGCSGTSRQ